jgi:hypothetical protein
MVLSKQEDLIISFSFIRSSTKAGKLSLTKTAQIVMCSSGARLNVVGLDATVRYLTVDNKFIARIDHQKCKTAKLAKSLLQYPLAKSGRFNLPDVFAVGMLESQDYSNSKGVKLSLRRIESCELIQNLGRRRMPTFLL